MTRLHDPIAGQNEPIKFVFDGHPMTAQQGDTIASALYAAGVRIWRRSRSGDERGLFCGIGLCYDCLVTVNGKPDQRACQTRVLPEMVIETNLKG